MNPSSSFSRSGIVALLFMYAAMGACDDPDHSYHPADLSTRPGERLWRVELKTPGLNPVEMDRLVADPLIRFLDKDGRVDVTSAISRHGSMEAFIRSPVYLSSVMVVSLALGTITLPNGTLDPEFEAAGPPLQSADKVEILADGGKLSRFGLSFKDLLSAIRKHPPPVSDDEFDSFPDIPVADRNGVAITLRDITTIREVPAGTRRPYADHVVRLEGTSPEQVNERIQELERNIHGGLKDDQNYLAIPTYENTVLLEPDVDAVRSAGLTANDIFSILPIIRGAEHRVWPQAMVELRMAELSPEDIAEFLVRDGVGNLVPLKHFASLQLASMPDRIIRKGLHTYSGYFLLWGSAAETMVDFLERTDFPYISTYSVSELPDAEAAILGWPIPRSKQ